MVIKNRLSNGPPDQPPDQPPEHQLRVGVIQITGGGNCADPDKPCFVDHVIKATQDSIAQAIALRECDPETGKVPDGYDLEAAVNAEYLAVVERVHKQLDEKKDVDRSDLALIAAQLHAHAAEVFTKASFRLKSHGRKMGQPKPKGKKS